VNEVGICTDSSALFPLGAVDRLGITVVPVAITLDGEPFDAREDAIDDFYARLSDGARATTSQPSPGEFLEAYARIEAGGAKEVLSIHLDARVSGTLASAELAAREAPIRVTVVDTRSVSFGVGVCVQAAAEAIASGASVREAAATVGRLSATLRNTFVARDGPAGRVPEATAFALLEFMDGKAKPRRACDTVGDAIEAMANRVSDENRPVRVAVGHAAAATEPAADALALSLESNSRVVHVERYRVGPAVGAHTGPLSFGAFWWRPRNPSCSGMGITDRALGPPT
jgi:DegV family protein with EDD domain